MFVEDHGDFEAAKLAARVSNVFKGETLENGTSLSKALLDALRADRRISRRVDATDVHLGLSDGEIADLGADLRSCFEGEVAFELPLGTTVTPVSRGSLKIAAESSVLDASRSGLHVIDTVRRDAHGLNLEALQAHITRLTRGEPCHRMGVPSAAFILDNDARHMLQFPPYDEAGGVVMQRFASDTGAARFCSATPSQIEALATSIVTDMQAFWARRAEIAAAASKVRAHAEAIIDDVGVEGFGVHRICIDMEVQRDTSPLAFYVEYDAIDEAMRPGVVLDYLISDQPDGPFMRRVPYGLGHRHEDRAALRAKGADGSIDAVALAVMRASPESEQVILTRLASSYETLVTFMTERGPLYATLYWREGCVKAEVTVPGHLDWYEGRLELFDCPLSEEDIAPFVGRPVASVPDLPFPCEGKITEARTLRNCVKFVVETREALLNLDNGEIWFE